MRPTILSLLLVLALASSSHGFECGANRFQNFITTLFIKLDCPSKIPHFDSCCRNHDSCYDRQGGKEVCDNNFCKCLDSAAKGTMFCQTDAAAFCFAVRKFGDKAYTEAKRG